MENIGDNSTIPIMEKQPAILGNQSSGTVSGTAPALYVLVKQTPGKSDQGTLISDQDNFNIFSSAPVPMKAKAKTYLSADCVSGNITVILDNNNMWNEFYYRSTEMILTKQGRRMFPYCRYWITGLESNLKYILVMDISPVDNFRYKWSGHSWEPSGKAEPHVLGRVFIHPESPSTGHYWMHQPVSFYKLKLTNNTLDQEGHIILHSMHRYLPRLHLVPADSATEVIQLNGPDVHTFTFPQTEFFAVTAYQNIQITQLKIDYNPFAKGFREDGLSSRLQRDVKQNGSSEHEQNSITTSLSSHKQLSEGNILDSEKREELSLSGVWNTDLERESLSPYYDFIPFMETDARVSDNPGLKEETSESSLSSPCQNISHLTSQLNSKKEINVSIKEEPLDDFHYGSLTCTEEVRVKQEEENNIIEEYSNNDDSILEQQLENYNEVGKMDIELHKEHHLSQLGVAKAKMLNLDSGKMPVIYLEPCAVTRNTVKIFAVSQDTSDNEKCPLIHSLDSLPACFENNSISSPFAAKETEKVATDIKISQNIAPQKSSEKDVLWRNNEICSRLTITDTFSNNLKATATNNPSLTEVTFGEQKTNIGNQSIGMSVPRKRGRPRKIKSSEAGRPPKYIGQSIATSNYASLVPSGTQLDVKPDLEDVDGMLFVSFASKEALAIHTVHRSEEKEFQNVLNVSLATYNPCTDSDDQRIQQLEKDLLEDLKSFKYKQVIHPSLQEVGLKLNLVDPTMSIDLKYLGVQLPLSYSDKYTSWKNVGINSNFADAGLPFVSRTGKTNDITKIKGWRGKLHNSSKNEGIILEGPLKNRSAFCSDKLDEYLENEGKLMETSMGFSPCTSSCPVVYQLPTKSTSYVRTLDSVLKKQSAITHLNSYSVKPHGSPSVSKKKKEKIKNKKQRVLKDKDKSSHKDIVALSMVKKKKCKLVSEEEASRSQPSKQTVNENDALMETGNDENLQSKQIIVRQVQQQQSSRLPSLSKTQLKLLDLEDCALWDGKPRTYITEERAELSLTILLTAQASLKNRPIHKIIKKKAPPCNNDFCRLGCICSSLALEKRQPTHCHKPDCMFGCTCLKRKVVLVKHKKILEKPLHGKHRLYHGKSLGQQTKDKQEKTKEKDKKKKKKVEYTICDTEPEEPVKNFPLWVKKDGEMDPEPIYIPTPSAIEATKIMMPPIPEILPSFNKPTVHDVKSLNSGDKPARVYMPRPNPVVREEDKDPVYLYFESMMTCARVRIYERKTQEKQQQEKGHSNCENHLEKENDAESQPLKIEEDKEGKEPGEKNWWFSCSAGDPSISYVHHITPDEKNKLIEIISDCNWEEDRKEILDILSHHIKNTMPKSFKVGRFLIELESESKTWDEKNTPIYSSRVKISMPSCQNKSNNLSESVESPNAKLSPNKGTEKMMLVTPGILHEQWKKGLPFYAGLSSAGKLIANTCRYDMNPSSLIQVNGKNSPQAKLLLGHMGALHPANRLAAYLTGRLQPSMFDISTIFKIAPSNRLAASESLSVDVPTSETSKTTLSVDTTSVSSVHISTQRQIAPRPLLDSMTSQLVINAARMSSPQHLTGPHKFNVLSSGTSTVVTTAATISMTTLPLTVTSPLQNNKSAYPTDVATGSIVGIQENNASLTTAAVEITKPVTTIAFVKSSTPVSTSLSVALPTIVSTVTVTSPTSSFSCGPSGILKSPSPIQKQGTMSPPGLLPGAENRMGPRLLLIPVHQGSALRPPQNMQIAQSKRMILQPLRQPGAVNLYRHPNGQIIQLVPLHQFQPAGQQSNLQPIMIRNPGSVVGIRLPGPSKLPEKTVCQSSAVPSMTPVTSTTSILSTSPSVLSPSSTTENPSFLSGSSASTTISILSPTTESGLMLSASSNALPITPPAEASSVLSMASTTDIPLMPVASTTLLVSSAEASSVLSLPTINASFVSPLPSAPPVSSVTNSPSVLSVSPTAPLLPVSPPVMSPITELSSAASEFSCINWSLQDIGSMAVPPASVTQTTPVPVSPTGTLTLRISPAGIKNGANKTSLHSKITCSASGSQNNINNLISLQSGSFALLQFPEQKDVPSSIAKQVASLDLKILHKKNEVDASKLEENLICSQAAEAIQSKFITLEGNKLPLYNPEFHSEEIMCDKNRSDRLEKDAEVLKQFSVCAPMLIPTDHSYISQKQKCEENGTLIKTQNQDKHSESPLDNISSSSKTVHEKCNQATVLSCDMLGQKTVCLKSSIQNPTTESEKAEQTESDAESELGKHKINNTEKLQRKTKSSLGLWKNKEPEIGRQNMKEKCDIVVKEKGREKTGGKAKNSSEKDCVDSGQERLYERKNGLQSNWKTSSLKKCMKEIQNDNQNNKGKQVSRPWDTIYRQSVLQSKIKTDSNKHAEKLRKSVEQNTWKHKCVTRIFPHIDITRNETEKDERNEDSGSEIIEVSGYQSEDTVNIETLNESEFSETEENVDIETIEEFSEKVNIARLKATAAHALLSKQMHFVRDHSNKAMAKPSKPQLSNKKLKNEEEPFTNYRQTHTANERRRRKELRGLFEKLKTTLGLQNFPKVSKCFILKQAFEDIQGLKDQADKFTGQKNLLLRKRDSLIRKVCALSGKTQEVVLKKLEYIYAKQKAVEAQKKKQQEETEPMPEIAETATLSLENGPTSLLKEMKPVIISNQRTKPLILSRKGNHGTGEIPSSIALTNTNLAVTTNGQFLALRSSLVPRQVTVLPSALLQAKPKLETYCNNGTVQSENEDSFMMPRIVNVTSLATEEETNSNLDKTQNYVSQNSDSQAPEVSFQVVSQDTASFQYKEKDEGSGNKRNVSGTMQDFLQEKGCFPQILNVSSLKGSPELFGKNLCIEELTGSQAQAKQVDRGGEPQKLKNSSFQKLQVTKAKGSGLQIELQKVSSAIHEPRLDANSSVNIEENDDSDETLTSLLNEIAFLNQQLNDGATDIPELPSSPHSGFSLGNEECHLESNTAGNSPFQFGTGGGNFKDIVQESSGSITPLLLHLDNDDDDSNREAGEFSSESDALKIMLGSEIKDTHSDVSRINRNGKNVKPAAKMRSVSPPLLHMKSNLEAGGPDMSWRPMPKLVPLGLKAANYSLDSEGQCSKMMPLLAPVASKEIKISQPVINPSQDSKSTQ